MTRLAIKRRQNIRAMNTLMRKHGYHRDDFEITEEYDSLMKRLPGTPVLFISSPFDGECDEREPVDELRTIRWAEKTDFNRLAREDDIRWRYGDHRTPQGGAR